MGLPEEVTLAFLPFARDTPALAQDAEREGHEVLAHVPMEAISATNPGPMTLKAGAPDIAERLAWSLARVPGLSGINNHEGSRFSTDAASLTPVAEMLAARHLFFFDSRTIAGSQIVPVAHIFGVESAGRDVFLDNVVTDEAVQAQLQQLAAEGAQIRRRHRHRSSAWSDVARPGRLAGPESRRAPGAGVGSDPAQDRAQHASGRRIK